eukprot:TRINITY_DN21207_c0_g1_i1.p1 TRINITY_DN21207_c0_g1~~TRINITY_DN21207_c0_g1_i1.p1  ORF type:complete len:804 (+),score=149.56 TRINITY_DN21207_c0_g1_i1:204-2615(+)
MSAHAPGSRGDPQPLRWRGAAAAVMLLGIAVAVATRSKIFSKRPKAWKWHANVPLSPPPTAHPPPPTPRPPPTSPPPSPTPPSPLSPAPQSAAPRLTLAGDLPAAPGEPIAPYPVLRDVLREQTEHGFHGIVTLRPNLSECDAAPNVSTDWLSDPFILGAQGPLLYRGGCRWSLACSAWCAEAGTGDGTLACAEHAMRRNLEALAEGRHTPDCWMAADHEGPQGHDGGGQLSVLRTPRNARLLAVHRSHWPLRLDWCGLYAGWQANRYARLLLPGERSLTEGAPQPAAAELAAERWEMDHAAREKVQDQVLAQGRLPYVSLLIEVPSIVRLNVRRKVRFRRTKTGRLYETERFDFTLWPDAAGPLRKRVIDRLARHLADDKILGTKLGTAQKRSLQYQLLIRSNTHETPWPPSSCALYHADPVVALPAPGNHKVMSLNLAHWTTEALYTLYNARVQAGEYVGVWPGDSWETWQGMARHSQPLMRVVNALVPLRLNLNRNGLCLQRLRLHVNSGWPIESAGVGLRAYARRIWGMPPEPLPAPAGGRLTATLVLRRAGGTRCITNWEDLRRAAAAQNWHLQLPLVPGTNKSSFTARLTEVAEAVSRSHVLAAMHGAEMAVAVFAAAAGSILVEICPWGGILRFSDIWYASYAYTAGVHVMRWYVPPNATQLKPEEGAQYPEQWKEWHEGPRPGKGMIYTWRTPVGRMVSHLEFVKRTRSDTALPLQGWRRLLRKARALLELQHREPGSAEIRGLPPAVPHPVAGNASGEAVVQEALRRVEEAAARAMPPAEPAGLGSSVRIRRRR